MRPIIECSHNGSRYVVIRFALKLAVFTLFCGVQIASGGPNLFFDLTMLAAGSAWSLRSSLLSLHLADLSTTGTRRSASG